MSALPLPRARPGQFVLGLVLIDLPTLVGVAVAGWFYGYFHTYEVIEEWRMAHPWSLLPSFIALVYLVRRLLK